MHSVLILAAGNSSRLKLKQSKIFLKLNNKSLIDETIKLAKKTKPRDINIVIKQKDLKKFKSKKKYSGINFYFQKKSLGTGHAVKSFLKVKKKNVLNKVLILYADTPFIRLVKINEMIKKSTNFDLVLLGFHTKKNKGLGLIKFDKKNNNVQKIIEYKNATQKEKKINLCNSGVMLLNQSILKLVFKIKKNKITKEYYLTDLIKILRKKLFTIGLVKDKNVIGSKGINTINDFEITKKVFFVR